MNLLDKNKKGIILIEKKVWNSVCRKAKNKAILNLKNTNSLNNHAEIPKISIPSDMFTFNQNKIIRITNSVWEHSQKINIKSIYKNINALNLKTDNIALLMPDDTKGIAFIKKVGSDISFTVIYNLNKVLDENSHIDYSFNAYNFFSNDYLLEYTDKEKVINEMLLKILVYLFYGEISMKLCHPKTAIKGDSFMYEYKNNSKNLIWIANSIWKVRISTTGFAVSGHFRLQPIGVNRSNHKLIFIEEFKKEGYNRKATIEVFNEG